MKPFVRKTAWAVGTIALVWGLSRASAVVTASWNVDSYVSFNKGEAKNAFITSTGEVRPGWNTEKVALEFGSAWATVRGKDGTTYVGSDDEGTIYKVQGKKVTKLARIKDAAAIVSLVIGKGNSLYAGTMPAGQVWRIDTKTKKARKLATLKGAETVWSLAQGKSNKLYAGTGPKGQLFEIDANSGKNKVVFSSKDKRILALAAANDGAVWLGTSDKAQVFRYDPKRKTTRAVADFAGNEVSALAPMGAGVIAVANDLKPATTTGAKTKAAINTAAKKKKPGQNIKKVKAGTKPGAEKATPSAAKVPRKGGRKGKGAMFRIRGDGHLTQLHALTSTYFTSLAVTNDGKIYAGAADKGRIYIVDSDDSVSTAFDIDERFIAQVLWSPEKGLSFTTGDSSVLYQSTGRAGNAVYKSEVFDAKAPARFGTFSWRGSSALKVQTRTGNTATPGVGWSQWKSPTQLHRGGGGSYRAKTSSPSGRYFQYRVKLTGDDSSLRNTKLFYLPQNRPTKVTKVVIKNKDEKKSRVTLQTSAAKPRNPVLVLDWDVENEDKDETEFVLHVRRDGEARWRRIRTGDKRLTESKYEWNTETFPDGFYRLRITAQDSGNNTRDRSLSHRKVTEIFLVDNQKPKLNNLSVRYPAVSAMANDTTSVIAEVAYSIDDEPWRLVGTQDGLFDDSNEVVQFALPKLSAGIHTLAIRVADSAGNVGSSTTSFQVR